MISPNLLALAIDTAPGPLTPPGSWPWHRYKKQSLIPEGKERVTLRLKKNINWELFKEWKDKRYPSITEEMARVFLPFIQNHYDCMTAGPPSARRDPSRYCVYDLARAISRHTGIPFVPAFAQKTDKRHHGRYESLRQSRPRLLSRVSRDWNLKDSSILFIDDCITSGTTARLCYQTPMGAGKHVDGLIGVSTGS